MIGIGTIVNVAAVIVGGMIGLIFNGGLKKRFQDIVMQALGLSVLFIGASGTMKYMLTLSDGSLDTSGGMTVVIALVLGALIGEWIDIEKRMEQFGTWIKSKIKGNNPKFVEGFVSSSLVICIGAMAVIGSIQDGIYKDPSMLFTKSILDFVFVLIFASTYGVGVIFSALPLGLYQGGITIGSSFIEPILTQHMLANLSMVGSILIFCIGINMLFQTKIKVGNLLPAILIACII